MKLCAFADEASSMLDGQISALKRNDIPYLEIRGVDGKNIKDVTVPEAKEIRKRLDDAGIRVWSIGSPVGKVALDSDLNAHFENYKQILECAYVLGAERIRMFSFFPSKDDSPEATREKAFAGLDKLIALTPNDMILCHENEKDIYGEQPESCLDILKEFPRLHAVFDPANFVQVGADTLKAWEMLKDYIDYMHIKDAVADGTVVPAGKGIGNVEFIVKDYLSRGGEIMTLEPHLNAFTGLAALENGMSLKHGISNYKTNDESFDAAANALKAILA